MPVRSKWQSLPTEAINPSSLEIDKLNADGKTIVLVTHDEKVAARADRVIHMKDGKVERDVTQREPAAVASAAFA